MLTLYILFGCKSYIRLYHHFRNVEGDSLMVGDRMFKKPDGKVRPDSYHQAAKEWKNLAGIGQNFYLDALHCRVQVV